MIKRINLEEELKTRKFIVAIDFDGTVVEQKFPDIGNLLPFAKEVINKLYDEKYYIIIWTCRYFLEHLIPVIDFLKENNIRYHKINDNSDEMEFNPLPKIFYDVLVDDRNLGGLKPWKETYKIITGKDYE